MTSRRVILMAALTTLFLLLAAARGADAHESEGVLAIESSTTTAGGRDYIVRLTWADDGHPAVDATVTATAVAADGTPGTPVSLATVDQDGRYRGEVALPTSGTWTVRMTAVTPAALLEVQEQVVATTTTTTGPLDSTSTTARPDAPTSTITASSTTSDDDVGNGGIGGAIALVALVAIVAGAVIGVARSRRIGEHE